MNIIKIIQSAIIAFLIIIAMSCRHEKEVATFKQFYKKHKMEEDFVAINISPGLARMFVKKEDKELRQILKDMDDIRILIYSDKTNNGKGNTAYVKELEKIISSKVYKDLMVIKDGDDEVKLMIRKKKGTVTELLIVIIDEKEFVVISLTGTIDLTKLKDISGSIDIDDLMFLDKLGNK